jgi:hypothetical protein
MAANSTLRSRLCRQRVRNGLIRVTIEVDEASLCEWLVAGEVLSPLETDKHEKVEQALVHAVTLLIKNHSQ